MRGAWRSAELDGDFCGPADESDAFHAHDDHEHTTGEWEHIIWEGIARAQCSRRETSNGLRSRGRDGWEERGENDEGESRRAN